MQDHDIFLLYCNKFASLGIEYMVTGSVASILYGEPRLTHDIDMVLSVEELDCKAFAIEFPLDDFYCPPVEVLMIESRRSQRGHFNLIHHETGFKADIYIASDTAFNKWAFANKSEINLAGGSLYVAPVEYVLVNKVAFYHEGGSSKHVADIKGMLEHSGELINWETVNKELERLSLNDTFKKMISDNY